ncbi:MAG: hypothetical protein AB7G75_30860 [Candidatus Binatia bacterium]
MRNHRLFTVSHLVAGLSFISVLCGGAGLVAAQVFPGDVLVVDHFYDSDSANPNVGALFAVDPQDGTRRIISNFDAVSTNPSGLTVQNPNDVFITADGTILVTTTGGGTNDRGTLFSVDPIDGSLNLITDFGNPVQGLPLGESPVGVLVTADGTHLVVDQDSGPLLPGNPNAPGTLYIVNPVNGQRLVLSDFGNFSQGPLGQDPRNLALLADGTLLVVDFLARISTFQNSGILFAVNPVSGVRTVVSVFDDANQGSTIGGPLDVAVTDNNTILVVARGGNNANPPPGALFTVDFTTGNRTILSDFGDSNQGPLGPEPVALAVMANGTILVSDVITNDLYAVNPVNGTRTVLSDFDNPLQGPTGPDPRGIAVVPGSPDDEGPVTTNVVTTPNPVAVNTAVTLTATVDDSDTGGSNIAAAYYAIDGGDLVPMSAQDGDLDEVREDVTATIPIFTEAGVYEVCVSGEDAAENIGPAECILLAVYDPDGDFVTGGGWIYSSPGWCQLNEACATAEGRANFGFVSKYKKGASIPTGNTEFNFSAGGLNFHSDTYDWLVVNQNGTTAQFKGSGTINGEQSSTGPYKFMIWARDVTPSDTFRIKDLLRNNCHN